MAETLNPIISILYSVTCMKSAFQNYKMRDLTGKKHVLSQETFPMNYL